MEQNSSQRGSIIIFSVLMLTVILTAGVALAGVLIPKLRLTGLVTNATVALYAADSGSELCLYEIRKLEDTDPPIARPLMTNGSDFIIASRSNPELLVTDSCIGIVSGSFNFRVTGRFHGLSRSLELNQ